ncbi:ion channel [Ruegeria sp. NA]|nr:ion channel [Ruegeria sp. NA]MCX8953134.1 ion channel [Ruegeria sp. NA]
MKQTVKYLYIGHDPVSVWFRYALILFDVATIIFFVGTAHIPHGPGLTVASQLVGVLIFLDFAARLWISKDRWRFLRQIYTVADIVVVLSLVLDPFLTGNLAFLRILRALRLIHSYHLLWDLRRDSRFFRTHEDAVIAAINLLVFVFTGFGDITLVTPGGKMFSVFIMVVGVALFVRLAQAIFAPQKVRHKCPNCGLYGHDPDAVHCKHCGDTLRIETGGAS